jgi:ketosteroid isomerase-like protein
MQHRLVFTVLFLLILSHLVHAQNSNSSTTNARPRTTNTNTNTGTKTPKTATEKPAPNQSVKPKTAGTPGSDAVLSAFNKIIDGIKRANVDLVTSGYLNSPSLVLFNYNGSVTKGFDQMRKNRESSYPDIKDVKLDVRDVHVTMLGRDGAVVTCLWTQSQTYKGAPDNASGRMTLVFKRVGPEWKAVHLHTSPDKADASRVPASEQIQSPTPTPKP